MTMKDITSTTIYEINRRLWIIFGENYDEFRTAFQNSGAQITKSFVTQCILGENWEESDINIIISVDERDLLFDTSVSFLDTDKNAKTMGMIEFMFSKYKTCFVGYLNHLNGGRFDVNGTKILFAIQYDIDIYNACKNIYTFNNSKEIVLINKINEIFTKYTNFNNKNCLMHAKYSARGFTFYDIDDTIVNNDNIWEKLNIDIVKMVPFNDLSHLERLKILTEWEYPCWINSNNLVIKRELGVNNPTILYHLLCPKYCDYDNIVSCFYKNKDCLFKYLYPGIEHLHNMFDFGQTIITVDTSTATAKNK